MAITWQNVNGNDPSGILKGLAYATDTATAGFDKVGAAFKGYQEREQKLFK